MFLQASGRGVFAHPDFPEDFWEKQVKKQNNFIQKVKGASARSSSRLYQTKMYNFFIKVEIYSFIKKDQYLWLFDLFNLNPLPKG